MFCLCVYTAFNSCAVQTNRNKLPTISTTLHSYLYNVTYLNIVVQLDRSRVASIHNII